MIQPQILTFHNVDEDRKMQFRLTEDPPEPKMEVKKQIIMK